MTNNRIKSTITLYLLDSSDEECYISRLDVCRISLGSENTTFNQLSKIENSKFIIAMRHLFNFINQNTIIKPSGTYPLAVLFIFMLFYSPINCLAQNDRLGL